MLALKTRVERLASSSPERAKGKASAIDLKARTFLQAIDLMGDSDEEAAPVEQKEEE